MEEDAVRTPRTAQDARTARAALAAEMTEKEAPPPADQEQPSEYFLSVSDRLLQDLKDSGFQLGRQVPAAEPQFPQDTTGIPPEELRKLYDEYLHFYEYLTDQLIQMQLFVGLSKADYAHTRARVLLQVMRDKRATNADVREALVATNEAVLSSYRDMLYQQAYCDMQEERRKKMSKVIERLYRELMLRSDRYSGAPPESPAGAASAWDRLNQRRQR